MVRRLTLIFILIVFGAALYFFNKERPSSTTSILTMEPTSSVSSQSPSEDTMSSEETHAKEAASTQKPEQMQARNLRLPKSVRGSGMNLKLQNAEFSDVPLLAKTRWRVWNGVTAVLKRYGEPSSEIVGEINGYYLVKGDGAEVHSFSKDQPFVVYDSRLGIAGVVTGVFSVRLKEGVSSQVLTDLGLTVMDEFPDIRTYYVTSPQEPFDLQALQNVLNNDPAVESSQMEILSRKYEKN